MLLLVALFTGAASLTVYSALPGRLDASARRWLVGGGVGAAGDVLMVLMIGPGGVWLAPLAAYFCLLQHWVALSSVEVLQRGASVRRPWLHLIMLTALPGTLLLRVSGSAYEGYDACLFGITMAGVIGLGAVQARRTAYAARPGAHALPMRLMWLCLAVLSACWVLRSLLILMHNLVGFSEIRLQIAMLLIAPFILLMMVGRHVAYFWLRIQSLRGQQGSRQDVPFGPLENATLGNQLAHEASQPLAAMRLTLESLQHSIGQPEGQQASGQMVKAIERIDQEVARLKAALGAQLVPAAIDPCPQPLAARLRMLQLASRIQVVVPSTGLLNAWMLRGAEPALNGLQDFLQYLERQLSFDDLTQTRLICSFGVGVSRRDTEHVLRMVLHVPARLFSAEELGAFRGEPVLAGAESGLPGLLNVIALRRRLQAHGGSLHLQAESSSEGLLHVEMQVPLLRGNR